MKAKQKTDDQIMRFFLFSILIASFLFIVELIVSNRLSNNDAQIANSGVFSTFKIIPFAIGAILSIRRKNIPGIILNLLLVMIILIFTFWIISWLNFGKDLQIILPD